MALDGTVDDDGDGAFLGDDGSETLAMFDAILDDGDRRAGGGERLNPAGSALGRVGFGGDEDPVNRARQDVIGEVCGSDLDFSTRCADDELTERAAGAERDLMAAG
jgi:hypothetical protein